MNDDNNAIDLVLADDADLLVKFCPKCRVQFNRSLENIKPKVNNWSIIDEIRKDMRCLNCRAIARNNRHCKYDNNQTK